jgi:transposase-like protein
MAKKRFKAEQIVLMLREADLPDGESGIQLAKGLNNEEVSRSMGIAPQSYYRWRKECGGMNY